MSKKVKNFSVTCNVNNNVQNSPNSPITCKVNQPNGSVENYGCYGCDNGLDYKTLATTWKVQKPYSS